MNLKWIEKGIIHSLRFGNFEMAHVRQISDGFIVYVLDKYEENGTSKQKLKDAKLFARRQSSEILHHALENLGKLKWHVSGHGSILHLAPELKKMTIEVRKSKSKYVGIDYEGHEICSGGKESCKQELLFIIGKRLNDDLEE